MEPLLLLPYGAEIAYRRETMLRDAASTGRLRRPRRTSRRVGGAASLLRRPARSRATVGAVHS
jgi:hypothetical protein